MKDARTEHTADETAVPATRAGKETDAPIDDGRTVSPMTAEWMPWNVGRTAPGRPRKENKEKGGEECSGRKGETLTREEKRAMLRGAFICENKTVSASFIFVRRSTKPLSLTTA